jgi:hypothetical protein
VEFLQQQPLGVNLPKVCQQIVV